MNKRIEDLLKYVEQYNWNYFEARLRVYHPASFVSRLNGELIIFFRFYDLKEGEQRFSVRYMDGEQYIVEYKDGRPEVSQIFSES